MIPCSQKDSVLGTCHFSPIDQKFNIIPIKTPETSLMFQGDPQMPWKCKWSWIYKTVFKKNSCGNYTT